MTYTNKEHLERLREVSLAASQQNEAGRKARVEEALRAVEAGQAPQASYVQTCSCGTTVVLTCTIHGEPVPTTLTTTPTDTKPDCAVCGRPYHEGMYYTPGGAATDCDGYVPAPSEGDPRRIPDVAAPVDDSAPARPHPGPSQV